MGFIAFLESRTDVLASSCSSYTRTHDEAPPEDLIYRLHLHRDLLDKIRLYGLDTTKFLTYFEEKYLPKYEQNVPHFLDDILPQNLKTKKYQALKTPLNYYIDTIPVQLDKSIKIFIGNEYNPNNFMVLNPTKDMFTQSLVSNSNIVFQYKTDYFNLISSGIYHLSDFQLNIITDETIIHNHDVVTYIDDNKILWGMEVQLYNEKTTQLKNLFTWEELPFSENHITTRK